MLDPTKLEEYNRRHFDPESPQGVMSERMHSVMNGLLHTRDVVYSVDPDIMINPATPNEAPSSNAPESDLGIPASVAGNTAVNALVDRAGMTTDGSALTDEDDPYEVQRGIMNLEVMANAANQEREMEARTSQGVPVDA